MAARIEDSEEDLRRQLMVLESELSTNQDKVDAVKRRLAWVQRRKLIVTAGV